MARVAEHVTDRAEGLGLLATRPVFELLAEAGVRTGVHAALVHFARSLF